MESYKWKRRTIRIRAAVKFKWISSLNLVTSCTRSMPSYLTKARGSTCSSIWMTPSWLLLHICSTLGRLYSDNKRWDKRRWRATRLSRKSRIVRCSWTKMRIHVSYVIILSFTVRSQPTSYLSFISSSCRSRTSSFSHWATTCLSRPEKNCNSRINNYLLSCASWSQLSQLLPSTESSNGTKSG